MSYTTKVTILSPTTCEPITVAVDKPFRDLWRVHFPEDAVARGYFKASTVRRWMREAKAKMERDAK